MPIEFEEYKPGEQRFSPTGRSLGIAPPVVKKKSNSILGLMIRFKLAKNEDYAKLYLLIVIIIAFSLTVFYGMRTWQDFHPNIEVAPIDLNQIQ